jgi:6-phosphogluconate dehydrogenase
MSMELGMIGLGRMGGNMVERLIKGGHKIVVYDPSKEAVKASVALGANAATSLADLGGKLSKPRAVWVMVPSGEPTETTIDTLAGLLSQGDIIIDGGNSNYKDGMRRAASVKPKEIHFLDCGTSGGIRGLKQGYCLMVGGEKSAFQRVEPVFKTLAPSVERGYAYMGPSGSGHFVKMIHNGIEYGMMEAIAEGFELMKAKKEFNLDLATIAENWRYGSVVRSWLLDLGAQALKEDPELEGVQSYVDDTGEGRWTAQEGIDLAVPLPVITLSLMARFRSRQEQPFAGKLLAALRNQFGGHAIHKAEKK